MKYLKTTLLLLVLPFLISASLHKFYVSTTKIEYVKEKGTLQIITKIFVDDLEQVLRERYSPDIVLDPNKETDIDKKYLNKYISKKFKISVNGAPMKLNYIGKEYDIDIVQMYFEIEGVSNLKSIEIENQILFEIFPEQQNIIHFKPPNRNLILDKEHPNGLLNFN